MKNNYLLLGILVSLLVLAMTACSSDDDNNQSEKVEPRPHPYPYDVKVGGICYTLVNKVGIAKVSPGDVYYAGNVIIPSTIEHDGTEIGRAHV